jgi:AraC-like DNA-binding protein
MLGTLGALDEGRRERSGACTRSDRIRLGSGAPGLERAEVHLSRWQFDQHRHDTYGLGITTSGVQRFRYRGAGRVCLPGQVHVLHPDEVHDGRAGTEDGFGYRILHLAPELVSEAAPGRPLPFVADPVQEPTREGMALHRLLVDVLTDIEEPISELRYAEVAAAVADALLSLAGHRRPRDPVVDVRAVRMARDHLREHAREKTPVAELEQMTGVDRFTLTRHFRRAFGTSPDRYRTLRRLALARAAIEAGHPLAQAAADAGFADQSHLSRQFKRAYGFTPGRWRALTAQRTGIAR